MQQNVKRPSLVIIDETGYRPVSGEPVHVCFQVVVNGSKKDSMTLISNLLFKQCDETSAGSAELTSAVHYRILDYARIAQIGATATDSRRNRRPGSRLKLEINQVRQLSIAGIRRGGTFGLPLTKCWRSIARQ